MIIGFYQHRNIYYRYFFIILQSVSLSQVSLSTLYTHVPKKLLNNIFMSVDICRLHASMMLTTKKKMPYICSAMRVLNSWFYTSIDPFYLCENFCFLLIFSQANKWWEAIKISTVRLTSALHKCWEVHNTV